jgi:hypothetical protein
VAASSPPASQQPDPDPPPRPGGGGPGSGRPSPGPARGAAASVTTAVDGGAGVLLGLLLWGWVVMPFLRGGQTEVKKVLMAKFLNKTPDGRWLP